MHYQIVATGETFPEADVGQHFPNMSLPATLSHGDMDHLGIVLVPDPAPTADQMAAQVQAKIDALWGAANAYTSGYISGVAIGLLTIGVIQSNPKALAISAWSASVWDEYYKRKALVTATSLDNYDFSSFGPIPHSVPELQAELGM